MRRVRRWRAIKGPPPGAFTLTRPDVTEIFNMEFNVKNGLVCERDVTKLSQWKGRNLLPPMIVSAGLA